MYRREKYIITPLLIVFFMHGMLYYAFPQYHYLSSEGGGWLTYIKYVCLFLAVPVLARPKFGIDSAVWGSVGVFLLSSTLISNVFWISDGNNLLLQFQMPILAYFFAPYLIQFFSDYRKNARILYFVLLVTALSMVFELLVGGMFGQYSRSGARTAGPFINPNNSGVFSAMVAISLHFFTKSTVKNLVIFFISAAILLLSGSKTAMLIYAVGLVLVLNIRLIFSIAFLGIVVISINYEKILALISIMQLREFSLQSGSVRNNDISELLSSLNNFDATSIIFGMYKYSVVDNAYLDILSYGGIYLVSLFVFFQLLSFVLSINLNTRLVSILFVMMFLAMLTTNIPRLWPTAYIYWALVGVIFYKAACGATLISRQPFQRRVEVR